MAKNTKGIFDIAAEQEPAPAPQYEQTALFDESTPAERFAAIKREYESMEAIREREREAQEEKEIAEESRKGKDPAYYIADLKAQLDEIMLLMERGSRPGVIATACMGARRTAKIIYNLTGEADFSYLVEQLNAFAFSLYPQEAQEATERTGRSIVSTPEIKDPKTGKVIKPAAEYILPDELEEYRKNNPIGAAEYEAAQPTKADSIKSNISMVSFAMDMLKSPGDALLSYNGIPAGYYARYEAAHMARLAQKVAAQTGGDIAQIMDGNRRTPEQQEILMQLAAQEQMQRMDSFFNSNYMQAVNILQPIPSEYTDGETDPQGNIISVKEQAVLYFFATHDSIKPTDPASLSQHDHGDLLGIFARLDAFYMQHGTGDIETDTGLFFRFIEQENPAPNAAESIAEKIPTLQGITPKHHTMPNNALMNALQQKELINTGEWDLPVSNATGKRKEITAYTMVTFDPGDTSITVTDAKLTEHERQISDAIISLWIEAKAQKLPPVFTTDMILRAMPGGGDKANPQQRGAITKAIEKFRRLHITVDATEEMRKRGVIDSKGTMRFDDFYLAATRAEYKVKNGGQTISAYRINAEPIIYTYCLMTKQLLTIPAKFLAIQEVQNGKATGSLIKMSAPRQAMTGYILRRIAVMKKDKETAADNKRAYDSRRKKDSSLEEKPLSAFRKQSDTITFETLFKMAGLAQQDRDSAKRNRNFCFEVLDYQKAVSNIKGYTIQRKGRSITGVTIET